MYQFPIGAIVDSFNLETREAIKAAAAIGAKGIQMYSTNGVNSPANLVGQARKDLLNYVKDNGMVFSAICGDFGLDLDHPEIVEKSKKVLYSAKELGCNIVTTHIGHLYLEEDARMELIRKNARELAEYADSIGSVFAAETGTEKAPVLKAFLDSLGAKGMRVNLDPANLVMVAKDDPVAAVEVLKDYIVHTHAKDGIVTDTTKHGWLEVPLGQGGVDWDNYLAALNKIGYTGYLTIERECGEDPAADIGIAVEHLKKSMAGL